MDFSWWISALLLACFLGPRLYYLVKQILSLFNHSSWSKDAMPNKDAVILRREEETVKYAKNDAKIKSTVYFTDGFRFETHDTERKNKLGSYQIGVDKAKIIYMAEVAHQKALQKLERQGKKIYTREEVPVPETPEMPSCYDHEEVPQGGWRCHCGRVHPGYESSCVCGKSKSECK